MSWSVCGWVVHSVVPVHELAVEKLDDFHRDVQGYWNERAAQGEGTATKHQGRSW